MNTYLSNFYKARRILPLLCIFTLNAAAAIVPAGLRCESREMPLGIDSPHPTLSWILESGENAQAQTAYQIVVLARDKTPLWDSGKVASGETIDIPYAGKPLVSGQEVWWRVRVWDQGGVQSAWSKPASFRMGILQAKDWRAKWIIGQTPVKTTAAAGLVIRRAIYLAASGGGEEKDVTSVISGAVKNGRVDLKIDHKAMQADPAPGKPKKLRVEYEVNGKPLQTEIADSKWLRIPALPGPEPTETIYLRRKFVLPAAPEFATTHVNVMGWFELYVNGAKVSADVLSPAATDFSKRSLYLTYDLKPYLRRGENVIGLHISRGWYWPERPGVVYDRPLARVQTDIAAGGQSLPVDTDGSWEYHSSGRRIVDFWQFANFGGEQIDARLDLPGWSAPEVKTSGWSPVGEVPDPGIPVVAQTSPPDRVIKTIPAVACRERGNEAYTLDFGTTLTGWLELKLPRLAAGKVVTIQYSDREGADELFTQRDEFTSAGKPGEVFCNKFNYRGFRYVTIKGLPSKPALTDAHGLAIAGDWATTGSFECSNPTINQMHTVNQWTIRSLTQNGYMSDCPHRERLGYGDGQNALDSSLMNYDLRGFYEKWQGDWRDVQKPDGYIPNTAPQTVGGGGPAWGGMLQEMAWRRYVYYGDRQALAENYEACQRFVALLYSKRKNGVYRAFAGGWNDLGDWVEPTPWELLQSPKPPGRTDPSKEEADFFNNCYLVHLTDQLADIAKVLDHGQDAASLKAQAEELRKQINKAWFQPEKNFYLNDKQAYLVMPLMAGVVPANLRSAVSGVLKNSILVKRNGHLDTGSTATGFLMRYLQENGGNDLIWTMTTQKTYPGFGYMLDQGATTWWEQWEGGPSRIHSCFLELDSWFYQGIAGIRPDPAAPGFKHFFIQPAVVGDLAWAKASYASARGLIRSEWKQEKGKFSLDVTVPPNTTATILLPNQAPVELKSGSYQFPRP